MDNYGFIRVAAATPKVKVADIKYNTEIICELIDKAEQDQVALLAFPELSVTGYSCGDLFGQPLLIEQAEHAIRKIKDFTASKKITVVVGAPIMFKSRLYNCAVVIRGGRVCGIVPKSYIPNYGEFYEARWFSGGTGKMSEYFKCDSLINEENVIISPNILFSIGKVVFAVEICEDLWTPIPPSSYHTMAGADIIVNLSASNEVLMKHKYRKSLIANHSARTVSAYVYSSCGYGESTQDTVFAGSSLIYETGALMAENQRFCMDSSIIEADIDVERIRTARLKTSTYYAVLPDGTDMHKVSSYYSMIDLGAPVDTDFNSKLLRYIEPHPFVPYGDKSEIDARAKEITSIQIVALATRLEHIGCRKLVIGISGGLDSTLALLVACMTYDRLGWDRSDIIGITMPGFGTTGRTHDNALNLMKYLGVTSKEISIVPAVVQHFKDIGQSVDNHDVTYENSQARERTQILMDIANKENGIVLGTGDLSELALGWATYNGDHMSMYGINSGIPKTLVKYLVRWVAQDYFSSDTDNDNGAKSIIFDICDTPISPELTPAGNNGAILQKTEDLVGPYELHDFFLYNFFRCGYSPSKTLFLAKKAFIGKIADASVFVGPEGKNNEYTGDIIEKWLKKFYLRFFSQQFKRSCLPDGPKIGSVSLSPRGDWRMPSDAKSELWIKDLENGL